MDRSLSAEARDAAHLARCLAVVNACNLAQGWGLREPQCRQYALALARLLDLGAAEAEIRGVVANYHADHADVAALREVSHPQHDRAWESWYRRVLGVLRKHGFEQPDSPLLDLDDLAQIARAELVRALPGYRYRSRLSTWAYRVIVQIAQRAQRDAQALKRAARPDSLDTIEEHLIPAAADPRPDEAAEGRQLADLVAQVLRALPDARLAEIFRLWAIEDRQIAEIGARFALHPSRVRALLQQSRQALRDHPHIRAWAE